MREWIVNKRLVWAGLLSSALVMPVIGAVAVASPSEKVRICHATGSQSNPYTSNNVNTSSVDERNNRYLNGHGDHAMDIIPPFESPEGTAFPGQNWAEGQGIWNNGCKVVVPTPTPTATPTETSTPTETPTPTGSATPEGSETPTPTETPSETPSVTPTATPTETPTPSITPTPRETTPPPTKKPTPSVTPTPTETPKASVTPTPRRTTAPPSATPSKTPRKTTPPVVVTPPPPATPDLPTCEQVADEQAGKTYAKDSPEAAGIPCR